MSFSFSGELPSSKSEVNRALIVRSFFPKMKLEYQAASQDIDTLRAAIEELDHRSEFWLGEGGTSFRFFALRLSRKKGRFLLKADPVLLKRPQCELIEILSQLGVKAELSPIGLMIESNGWKKPHKFIRVNGHESSQFLSALALASWGLEFSICIELVGKLLSRSYWDLTWGMLQDLGMVGKLSESLIEIPAGQKLNLEYLEKPWVCEPDMSSCFSLSAAAVLDGAVHIKNFPTKSRQPDFAFVEILRKMNVPIQLDHQGLKIQSTKGLKCIHLNLQNYPDLFPVLASLCCFADGDSVLHGAPHLRLKESNRIEKTAELLGLFHVPFEILDDGICIRMSQKKDFHKQHLHQNQTIVFDCAKDHRMAFAASLFMLAGFKVDLRDPLCVSKSFANYWDVINLAPAVGNRRGKI